MNSCLRQKLVDQDPHCFIYTRLIRFHNGIALFAENQRLVKKSLLKKELSVYFIYLNNI